MLPHSLVGHIGVLPEQHELHAGECFVAFDKVASDRAQQLLSHGKILIIEATSQARKMVQEQAMAPVIDMITLDADGSGTEIGTLPLFPVVPGEECEQILVSLRRLAQWHQKMAGLMGNLKRFQNGDQNEEV